MLIRRRIEKLERSLPPTIANLVDRIEREANNVLSRDQQRIVNGSGDGVELPATGRYQEALSGALKQVSDDDLDRMILYYQPNASRSECCVWQLILALFGSLIWPTLRATV